MVIGTPMYNFGVPAVLKAYVDQIVRYYVTYGSASQIRSECTGLLPMCPRDAAPRYVRIARRVPPDPAGSAERVR